ncbi:MAG: hydroxyisourate hydrolase [Acidiferrobacterales bacterium]|nr:hydroxyisourate hydrolase [Acidiferrobacterales bacterium]
MTKLTSHVLDAVAGQSAVGIRVALYAVYPDNDRELVFEARSDEEGRIAQEVAVSNQSDAAEYELVFYGYEYLVAKHGLEHVNQNMQTSVVRFTMASREQRYHIPLVLSPHSYTVWWSE